MTKSAIIIAYVARTLAGIKTRLVRGESLNRYRPERHYMRGPGPQWHAKHDSLPSGRCKTAFGHATDARFATSASRAAAMVCMRNRTTGDSSPDTLIDHGGISATR